MALINVTAAHLKAQAEELKQLNATFKSTVNELESTEAQLNSMWEGEANTAFHNAFSRDKIQMDNFYNAIEVYVNALLTIASKYQLAEGMNVETATTRNY